MPWISRLLRGDRVWARTTPSGALALDGEGRVEILYKRGGKPYRAAGRNLDADPAAEVVSDADMSVGHAATGTPAKRGHVAHGASGTSSHVKRGAVDGAPLLVFADGACSGNPGPAGIGVVLLDGTSRREISEYLGEGTNNIAELMAIVRALEEAPRDRPVEIHSDSAYALGLLGKGWKAKANQELVAEMRAVASEFADLKLVKVKGHAGVPENERADALARQAVETRGPRPARKPG